MVPGCADYIKHTCFLSECGLFVDDFGVKAVHRCVTLDNLAEYHYVGSLALGRLHNLATDPGADAEAELPVDGPLQRVTTLVDVVLDYSRYFSDQTGFMLQASIADVTTNTVEGFFTIFKRCMRGIFRHCGEQHLPRYLAEFDSRHTNRIANSVNDNDRAVIAICGVVDSGSLTNNLTTGRPEAPAGQRPRDQRWRSR